ncbi:MAG: phytoene desaturase family protein [Trueperaceae bacterium]|nr:phytoene desaturase family protein [Trueperaceae bacterium]
MNPRKVVIIGSGFGALGTAARLLADGHEVTLYEARDKLGGRAYTYEQDGFVFDGGPTIITAPWMFDEIWAKAGKDREDYVKFVKCDPFYRIFDDAQNLFDYNDDEMFILNEIEKRNPSDKRGYLNFMKTTKDIFEKGFVELADEPFLHFTDMLRVAPDLIRLQSYKSVYKYVSQYVQDPFLRQVFSFHPLLVGGNPFDTPSIYAMIHYLEREWGVWYAIGGTGKLVEAFERLIKELGGTIHVDRPVAEILVRGENRDRQAYGVRLEDGAVVHADVVVSNADVATTYMNMIAPEHRKKYTDRKLERMDYAMSLFVLYFGTDKQYRHDGLLKHHNIILGPRYEGLLRDIFKNQGRLADDFSLYLHMPSYTDPSMAPEGHESFYVLSPVPNLTSGIDWRAQAKPYRDAIMNFLEANYLPGLQEHLVTEHYIDPLHFQGDLRSFRGSAFAFEPKLTQSAWFRPHNRSEEMPNLYFVGAGTHPGGGLPGVLSSAKIADKLINQGEPRKQAPSDAPSDAPLPERPPTRAMTEDVTWRS